MVELPNDLIPVDDIQECGYVEDTGFVWMKWKVEQQKMKKVSGVKSKELREWITISEISIDDPASAKMKDLREWITVSEISINGPASAKICFKSDIGNNKSFSVVPSPTKESAIAGTKKGSE